MAADEFGAADGLTTSSPFLGPNSFAGFARQQRPSAKAAGGEGRGDIVEVVSLGRFAARNALRIDAVDVDTGFDEVGHDLNTAAGNSPEDRRRSHIVDRVHIGTFCQK